MGRAPQAKAQSEPAETPTAARAEGGGRGGERERWQGQAEGRCEAGEGCGQMGPLGKFHGPHGDYGLQKGGWRPDRRLGKSGAGSGERRQGELTRLGGFRGQQMGGHTASPLTAGSLGPFGKGQSW